MGWKAHATLARRRRVARAFQPVGLLRCPETKMRPGVIREHHDGPAVDGEAQLNLAFPGQFCESRHCFPSGLFVKHVATQTNWTIDEKSLKRIPSLPTCCVCVRRPASAAVSRWAQAANQRTETGRQRADGGQRRTRLRSSGATARQADDGGRRTANDDVLNRNHGVEWLSTNEEKDTNRRRAGACRQAAKVRRKAARR